MASFKANLNLSYSKMNEGVGQILGIPRLSWSPSGPEGVERVETKEAWSGNNYLSCFSQMKRF